MEFRPQEPALFPGTQKFLSQAHNGVPVIAARHGQHGVFRAIHPPPVIQHLFPGKRLHGIGSAQNGPGDRLVSEMGQHQHFVHQILRRVLRHIDLFQHDALFLFHFHRVEHRPHRQVADDVQGQAHVFVHHLGVKTGAFLGGKGVQLSPHLVHLLGNVPGGAGSGSLEDHVLDIMADAGLGNGFILRARADPQAHGNGAKMGNSLAHDAQPVGQRNLIKNHSFLPEEKAAVFYTRQLS